MFVILVIIALPISLIANLVMFLEVRDRVRSLDYILDKYGAARLPELEQYIDTLQNAERSFEQRVTAETDLRVGAVNLLLDAARKARASAELQVEKLTATNEQLTKRNVELEKRPPVVEDPPMGYVNVRRQDFMASTLRGLLLHTSLVSTGGEAHRRVRNGEVLMDDIKLSEAEAPPPASFKTNFTLRCGNRACVVTVVP